MGMMFTLSLCIASSLFADTYCYSTQSIQSSMDNVNIVSLNNHHLFTGSIDSQMVICSQDTIHHTVTSLNESVGILINDKGTGAGIGRDGTLQDDNLIIVHPDDSARIELIEGSEGWASLRALNEIGSVVGNYSGGSGSSDWQAFIYTHQTGIQFISPNSDSSYAYALSENNQVAGYIEYGNQLRAMTSFYGIVTDLTTELGLKGHSSARFFDENNRVLISEYVDGFINCYWYDQTSDQLIEIYSFPPGTYSFRMVASSSGRVAFSWTDAKNSSHLLRWSDDSGIEEAALSEEIIIATAVAISDDGTVASQGLIHPFYHQEPIVWHSGEDSPVLLNQYLPNFPLSSQVEKMNNNGEMLIKIGSEYFLLNSHCKADLNHDGSVNVSDILLLIDAWGSTDLGLCSSDIDSDGVVAVSDLLVLIDSWGECE